jgi:hypothetical protein
MGSLLPHVSLSAFVPAYVSASKTLKSYVALQVLTSTGGLVDFTDKESFTNIIVSAYIIFSGYGHNQTTVLFNAFDDSLWLFQKIPGRREECGSDRSRNKRDE